MIKSFDILNLYLELGGLISHGAVVARLIQIITLFPIATLSILVIYNER